MRKVPGEYPAPSDVPSSGRCLTPSESDTQAAADAGAVRSSVGLMHRAVARCLTPKVSDTQAAADAGAVRSSVRIDAPGGGTVSDSEGVRHPGRRGRRGRAELS